MIQKTFRLTVPRTTGSSQFSQLREQQLFNRRVRRDGIHDKGSDYQKLFADLLKRQSNRVCADLTQADSVQIPAHLARLELVQELIRFAFNHGQVLPTETVRSERQLCNPLTLADWQEVLLHTRQCHRAPAFLNQNETDLQTINRKLDTIAGLLANSPLLAAMLESEDESEVQS